MGLVYGFSAGCLCAVLAERASSEKVLVTQKRLAEVLDDRVRFLEGWFKDTLPSAPIKKIAVLRLDGDFYESTAHALVNLYDKVSPGGYIIVDDYAEDLWTNCRRAVDGFRLSRGIQEPLQAVDAWCYYWQKNDV